MMTDRNAIPSRAAKDAEFIAGHRYAWNVHVDPWIRGFCTGYIWTWKVLGWLGFKEEVPE